jgi:diguanylate cyclase (GGDEF)-like protein
VPTIEAAYLAGRVLLAGLCLAVAMAAVARVAPRPGTSRVLPRASAATLVLAALLSLHDAWDNAVTRWDEPIGPANWAWLGFDLLLPVVGALLLRAIAQRDAALSGLAALAETDALTGLRNRRGFLAAAEAALARAARHGERASVVMLDLDRFKAINDAHGHAAGDAVLRATAEVLQSMLRGGDLAGRLGGEEFVLLLPGASAEVAAGAAERLRRALAARVPHPDARARVTASFGVATVELRASAPEAALEGALRDADAALYAAKRAGRDRIALAEAA